MSVSSKLYLNGGSGHSSYLMDVMPWVFLKCIIRTVQMHYQKASGKYMKQPSEAEEGETSQNN